ncbi:transcriptional regulator TetR family (plasmid) [Cupriavidus necator N-1]|uniref:Transcriptional regulator TetR family n=1 Tax=Cupriavidus necator (strain ATCC 43291 / DSM 13513 / CCUG 52238 / LMG 8453 / N-1) TaxID=1042878 RepID=F8GX63_CUPNN|nr:TetR/AcrR family transcriptional regulator [Cupriavidus necator]AEI81933.1 transcriptional regulator TetR family [Cupriavidus necator N-1]MDX6008254.1 TetR/AcrR family transcriptional regulator [Cupriavidus necator]
MVATLKRQEDHKRRPPHAAHITRQTTATAVPAQRPPRQLRSEETLAKMILAGRDLIEQHGNFDLVLISDVIRIAGTSIGAFYGRFKDKDAFIASVLDAAFAEMRAGANIGLPNDAASVEQGTASEFAARIVRYYVDMCRRNHGMFKAVLRHFAARNPDLNPMRCLDRHIQSLVAPALAKKMQAQAKAGSESEVRIGMQMVVGTLYLSLLIDPGPLRVDGDLIETKLTAMMHRFLLLT